MFRSLRFRLPALFLAGIAVSGLVASAIALGLFQNYTRKQALSELRREAKGLARLYAESAGREVFRSENLEEATGDRIFYIPRAPGISPFPGEEQPPFRQLPRRAVARSVLEANGAVDFEFTPPGEERQLVAIARPLLLGEQRFGTLIVATPKSELREQWLPLVGRLGLAFLVGIAVAGALAWYLSRRITRPVLTLSQAADELAAGRYSVQVPRVRGGDEIADLTERFGEMAARLAETEERERNFLMSVSHELRTPLTAIRGHVAALREGVADDPDLREDSLAVIAREAERLERLVGDVLDLAKLDADRFTVLREEVDMGRLCEEAYSAFGEEARRRGIDYRQEAHDRPVILSDGDRVLQIISNLLRNAFQWTPDGGRIELELGAANGTVSVAVADTGPGIAWEDRDRIFRPFWSRNGGGTGLGLAIARELAVALGGRIEVDSAPGEGSRFRLVLPGELSRLR